MSQAKAFLHESVVYEYMNNRILNGSLSLKPVVTAGKDVKNARAIYITELKISNTFFPDVDKISIKNTARPAEIKFLTSDFKYHKTHKDKFTKFKEQNGCIIVLKHDELPNDLPKDYRVDVYQLDKDDFAAFARENFDRFYNKQLNNKIKNTPLKVWLTSQSPNFHGKLSGKENPSSVFKYVSPASESKIWCPTYRSQINEIDLHDRIVFARFGGTDQQNAKQNGKTNPKWLLKQLYIAQIVRVESREDYCKRKKRNISDPLWKVEKNEYNHVFEFEKNYVIDLDLPIVNLDTRNADLLYDTYTQPGLREISKDKYMTLTENILEFYQQFKDEQQSLLQAKYDALDRIYSSFEFQYNIFIKDHPEHDFLH